MLRVDDLVTNAPRLYKICNKTKGEEILQFLTNRPLLSDLRQKGTEALELY